MWATDLDVLPRDRVIERRDGYMLIRSPRNPSHYWGNLLLFEDPPLAGSRAAWEALFETEFGAIDGVEHRTFAWDRTDGKLGAAIPEFVSAGYELERTTGLIAPAEQLAPHPRENRDVEIRPLHPGGDADLWAEVTELQVAARDPVHGEDAYRAFSARRLVELHELFAAGRGAWYVALDAGAVVASCGIVVTSGRGRYQAVDTAEAHRRKGICSRLLIAAARDASARFGAHRFVIAADPDYHALGLYESLGFRPAESVAGVFLMPPSSELAPEGTDAVGDVDPVAPDPN